MQLLLAVLRLGTRFLSLLVVYHYYDPLVPEKVSIARPRRVSGNSTGEGCLKTQFSREKTMNKN